MLNGSELKRPRILTLRTLTLTEPPAVSDVCEAIANMYTKVSRLKPWSLDNTNGYSDPSYSSEGLYKKMLRQKGPKRQSIIKSIHEKNGIYH